jgi:secondary thiamine-phosphate synthase enzyme
MKVLKVHTHERLEAVNITLPVQDALRAAGIVEGLVHLHCPHTTAALVVNESADPDVVGDILRTWEKLVPRRGDYRHAEGNSQAHVLASLAGCGVLLPVAEGRLRLGTWQGVFFLELDGPRRREVWMTPAEGGR